MTKQNETELIQRYVTLMRDHHRLIYVERGLGSQEERELKHNLENRWKSLSSESRRLLSWAINEALTVPRINGPENTDNEESKIVRSISGTIELSLSIIQARTQALLRRRLEGDIPLMDDNLPEEYKIFSVEARVPQRWYPSSTPLTEFKDHYVKIGIQIDAHGNDYEYVWVDHVEPYEEKDSSIREPDQLSGVLAREPHFAEGGYSFGTPVTFKVSEVQDVMPLRRHPADLSSFYYQHLTEGLEGILLLLLPITTAEDIQSISREMRVRIWENLSDREQRHLISFTRGMRGREKT